MKAILRGMLIPLLVTGLVLSGCSSKKKDSGVDSALAGSEVGGNNPLELNGDSDSSRAGGLMTVYFAYDSSVLSDSAKSALEGNANFMKANPSVEVQIEGHCDERGGIQYNIALGEKRAKTVKQYLEAMGVASKRMTWVSYGKERPLEFGHSENIWSKNRRANFVVTTK